MTATGGYGLGRVTGNQGQVGEEGSTPSQKQMQLIKISGVRHFPEEDEEACFASCSLLLRNILNNLHEIQCDTLCSFCEMLCREYFQILLKNLSDYLVFFCLSLM